MVIAAIGSSIFLKERLSFVGKVGCFLCILGAVIITLNAPEQPAVSTIQQMKKFVLSKVFLPYAGVIFAISLFLHFWAAPRYGSKNMFVYLSICSLVGGVSVVCTQGFGASIVSAISGTPNQWNNWFLYVLFIFVVCTLLVEIVFLNKALNIFNTSVVCPSYYTYFTSMTIISSAVLFQGFKGSATEIITVILGFLCIVAGVVLLQVSLAAQSTPDSQVLKAELNDVQDVLQQPVEDDVLNPGAASIRGALSVRRFNTRNVSQASQIDSLRRRQTVLSSRSNGTIQGPRTLSQWRRERPQHSTPQGISLGAGPYEQTNEAFVGDHTTTIRFVPPMTSRTTIVTDPEMHNGESDSHYQLDDYYDQESLDESASNKVGKGPQIYASEMQRKLYEMPQPDPGLPPRLPPLTIDKTSRSNSKTTVNSRLRKQFSFATRRDGNTEEEKVGLTDVAEGDLASKDWSSDDDDDDFAGDEPRRRL